MTEVQKLEIKGFRSLKSVSWVPDRLNVVIGPNGAGKSNFLWSLEFLRRSAEGNLRDSVLNEGGIRQLLWDHRATEVAWTLKLATEAPPRFPKRSLTYDLALRPQGFEGGFYIDRELLADYQRVDAGEKKDPFKFIERDPNHAVIWDEQDRRLTAPSDTIPNDRTALSELFPFGAPWIIVFARALLRFRIYHDLSTDRKASVRELRSHASKSHFPLTVRIWFLYCTRFIQGIGISKKMLMPECTRPSVRILKTSFLARRLIRRYSFEYAGKV
jgi:predicted ATPase